MHIIQCIIFSVKDKSMLKNKENIQKGEIQTPLEVDAESYKLESSRHLSSHHQRFHGAPPTVSLQVPSVVFQGDGDLLVHRISLSLYPLHCHNPHIFPIG